MTAIANTSMFQLLYALFHFKLLRFSPRIQPRAALLIFRRINPLSISAVYASINQKTDPFYTYSHLSYRIQPRVHQQTSFHYFPRTSDFIGNRQPKPKQESTLRVNFEALFNEHDFMPRRH